MRYKKGSFCIIAFVASSLAIAGVTGVVTAGVKRQDRVKTGVYEAKSFGYYQGAGTADVRRDRVSIQISVAFPGGLRATLSAEDLVTSGPYFSGVGTLGGQQVQISGRLDAPRASRLTAFFYGTGNRTGRIIAHLPPSVDPGDDTWDDGPPLPDHGAGDFD